MRLPLVNPVDMSPMQKKLYERNKVGIERGFNAFKTMTNEGELLGPWGVFIQEPEVGEAHYDLLDVLTGLGRLSPEAKQVAILSVGAHFRAAYELYAHVAVARQGGMSVSTLSALAAGTRPDGLGPDQLVAFEVAHALCERGVLPSATYRMAREVLGQPALNELVLWIAQYAYVSLILNAFDVPSEEQFQE
jgi:4-carboxymuconolactone decarboxylase